MLESYKHILLATDFTRHSEVVAQRATNLAQLYKAKLSVVHVVDNLPIADSVYGPVIPYEVDRTSEILSVSKRHLAKLAAEVSIPEERQWLELGSPKLEIIRIAEENEIDLIVLGSHGTHGLALLLGSTANGVLHYAKCDVLAVRLQEK